jgi:hypothetical protein
MMTTIGSHSSPIHGDPTKPIEIQLKELEDAHAHIPRPAEVWIDWDFYQGIAQFMHKKNDYKIQELTEDQKNSAGTGISLLCGARGK